MPPPKTQRQREELASDLQPSERSFEGAPRWLVCEGIWETMTLAWGRLRLGVSGPELPTSDILAHGRWSPIRGESHIFQGTRSDPNVRSQSEDFVGWTVESPGSRRSWKWPTRGAASLVLRDLWIDF